MKRNIIIITIILIIAIILTSTLIMKNKSNKTESNLQTIKVNEVTRSVFYAPQYVAINNGYFKDYGIELDLTTGQRSRNTPSLKTTFFLVLYSQEYIQNVIIKS